jgi:hypothetical protein
MPCAAGTAESEGAAMNGPIELMVLISEAMERGCDVTITIRPTANGEVGRLFMPDGWQERLARFVKTKASK